MAKKWKARLAREKAARLRTEEKAKLSEEERKRLEKEAAGRTRAEQWRDSVRVYARDRFGLAITDEQEQVLEYLATGEKDLVAVKAGQKTGKALDLDTPLPTPRGWTTMGEVEVGDVLFDERGHRCRVLKVSDVFIGRTCYEVEFTGGEKIVADAEHEWETWSASSRRALGRNPKAATPRTVTTEQIRGTIDTEHRGREHGVAVAGPIECSEKVLPIPPYVLGVWLGDGHSRAGYVTTADEHVLYELAREGFESRKLESKSGGLASTYALFDEEGSLRRKLLPLGVLGDKRVPVAYLRASRGQRLALLQGLFDTDGTCDKRGRSEFVSTRKCLAESVHELACSLGLRPSIIEGLAKLDGRVIGPKWTVGLTTREPIFRLPRKLDRMKAAAAGRDTRFRTIKAVKPIESVPVRCITVDSPSSLFLCGRGFIPTHNSCLDGIAVYWFAECHGYTRVSALSASGDNLAEVLWSELRALWAKSQLAEFPLGIPEPSVDPKTGFSVGGCRVVGLVAAKVESIGGISGARQLFIVDEASSEKFDLLWEGIEGNRTGGGKVLLTANPTRTAGVFFNVFRNPKNRRIWKTFTLSSVVASRYGIPGMADKDVIAERIEVMGEDHPLVKVRVFGEFPDGSTNAVVSLARWDRATYRFEKRHAARTAKPPTWTIDDEARWQEEEAGFRRDPLHVGVDVAYEGDDDSVIFPRRGKRAYKYRTHHGEDPVELGKTVIAVVDELGRPGETAWVKVDTCGIGAGTYAYVKMIGEERRRDKAAAKHAGRRYEGVLVAAVPVNVAERPTSVPDPDDPEARPAYANLRAQIAFAVSDWMREGGVVEPDERLEEELLAPTFSLDGQNRLKVESKKEVKKRLKRSPDAADGLQLAVYEGTPAEDHTLPLRHSNHDSPGDGVWNFDDSKPFGI